MSIVEASSNPVVVGAALMYAHLGLSVIPLKGKLASAYWIPHQKEPASQQQIWYWFKRGLMENVGIVCGAVSGNLVVMDLDSLQTVTKFEFTFPELLDTYTVASSRGKHIYWYVEELPPTTKTEGYELRANGMYVAAPPSVHPSGKQYTVCNPVEIARVSDLNRVVEFVTGIAKERQHETRIQQPEVAAVERSINKKNTGRGNYRPLTADEELRLEVERVAFAPDGNGNNTLYYAALKLGSLVADRKLTINEIEIALMRAADASGLVARDGERKCMRTIKSGLDTGMKNSRKDWRAKHS